MRGRQLLLLAAAWILVGCGSGAPVISVAAPGRLPAGGFLAQYAHGAADTDGGHGTSLTFFDRSGRPLRDLLHLPERSPVHLAGYGRAGSGDVVYAAARGPYYRSGVSGGDPKPDSCGGTVYRVSARTGTTEALFTVPAGMTVSAPAPNPAGTAVAYLSQPCTASFAQQVVVRELATGRERRVGVTGRSAVGASWNADGSRLLITVFSSSWRSRADDITGYLLIGAGGGGTQPGTAIRSAPDSGCAAAGAAFDAAGIAVVEGCPDTLSAPARLVQLDTAGRRVRWRAPTGLCPNGITLGTDRSGQHLLLTGTTTCGGAAGAPVDIVQEWTGPHHTQLGRYTNPQQFVRDATW